MLRYVTRRAAGRLPRWHVWDTQTGRPYAPYLYRSMHKCNKSCDRLNGLGIREAQRYRMAKEGEYNYG